MKSREILIREERIPFYSRVLGGVLLGILAGGGLIRAEDHYNFLQNVDLHSTGLVGNMLVVGGSGVVGALAGSIWGASAVRATYKKGSRNA
jgi:hypothetical protein